MWQPGREAHYFVNIVAEISHYMKSFSQLTKITQKYRKNLHIVRLVQNAIKLIDISIWIFGG